MTSWLKKPKPPTAILPSAAEINTPSPSTRHTSTLPRPTPPSPASVPESLPPVPAVPPRPPVVPPRVDVPRQGGARGDEDGALERQVYFHPKLSEMSQIKIVMGPYANKPGYFLVRKSFSKRDSFTITVMHQSGIKHINIDFSNLTFYIKTDRHFSTIPELVAHYSTNPVPNLESIPNVLLQHPIPRDTPLTPHTSQSPHRSQPSSHIPQPLHLSQPPPIPSGEEISNPTQKSAVRGNAVGVYLHHETPVGSASPTAGQGSTGRRGSLETTPGKGERSGGMVTGGERSGGVVVGQGRRGSENRGASESQEVYYYSEIVEDGGMADRLIQHLQVTDCGPGGDEHCECGLLIDESQLARGWSFHISRDHPTNGRVFFLSPDGDSTWELPLAVSLELSPDQQDRLRDLLRASDLHISAQRGTAIRIRDSEGESRDTNSEYFVSENSDQGTGLELERRAVSRGLSSGGVSRNVSSGMSGLSGDPLNRSTIFPLDKSSKHVVILANSDAGYLQRPPGDKIVGAAKLESFAAGRPQGGGEELKPPGVSAPMKLLGNLPRRGKTASLGAEASATVVMGGRTIKRRETEPKISVLRRQVCDELPHYMPMSGNKK